LKQGRRAFEKRRVLVAGSHAEAADLLDGGDTRQVFNHDHLGDNPEVVFMFPGGGAQYAGMARDLYATEPVFADWMDRGLAVLQPKLDYDIRALWLPDPGAALGAEAAADARLKRPSVQLPLIMITEYALAQLFQSWGVQPAALVGHSMGENTAACLAGVFSFDDCIGLVHLRGQLFDTIAAGGMLSVPLPQHALRAELARFAQTESSPFPAGTNIPGVRGLAPGSRAVGTTTAAAQIDLASVNAPGLCVVSGPDAALQAFADQLAETNIDTTRIAIDIAAHSWMLEPVLARFGDYLRAMRLTPPTLPIISNRTGVELTAAQATDPDYWVAHLRGTVNFQACMATLIAQPGRVYVEMGPGRALSSLAQANGVSAGQVIPALRHPEQKMADDAWHIATVARLWACGVPVDWEPIWGGATRHRVPLPSYAFQRKTYFIEPGKQAASEAAALPTRTADMADWGYVPSWRPTEAGVDIDDLATATPQVWLMFVDEAGLGAQAAARLRSAGHQVICVRAGDRFAKDAQGYVISPERGREGYDLLIRDLVAQGHSPTRIAHFWLVTGAETFRPGSSFLHRNIEQGFYSLLFLAQAMTEENLARPVHLSVFTTGAAQVKSEGLPHPEKALVMGPARVIPREVPGLTVSVLDLVLPKRGTLPDLVAHAVIEELLAAAPGIAALRGARRYALGLKPARLPDPVAVVPDGAHVVITGGFGGIGLTIAEDLIARHGAKITLIARRGLPDRSDWARHLATHDPAHPISRRILALQRLEALGGQVLVAQADVCNVEDMRAAVAMGVARFGRVSAVIHAAGVVDDGPLMTKTPAQVEEVFAPKLHGTLVLDGLFPDGSVDLMVLFSSTSTVTGPAGQIDYVAANEYLNAYAKHRAGGKTRVVALDWGIWTGVGMAAEALADRAGERPAAPKVPVAQPLLDEAGFDRHGNRQFTARLGVDRWVLNGHRTSAGQALLPGTGVLELAAEAMAAQGEAAAFEVRDLLFFRPLEVQDTQPREIRVTLTRSDEGYGFGLHSGVPIQGRVGWQMHAQARLLPLTGAAGRIDAGAIVARCGAAETGVGLSSPQEAHLTFGPRWRVLSSRSLGAGEGLAHLALPAAFREADHALLLHPALMDLAIGWAMGLIAGYRPDHLWVPVSYGSVRVFGPLPADVVSWVRNTADNRADHATASFDITLAAPDGRVVVEIEGFSIRRMDGALSFAPDLRGLEFDEGPARATSPAEERLLHAFSLGIRPDEGALAFARAVTAGGPQIIVSSLDLPALIAQSAEAEAARTEGQSFERPDLDTDYVAPRNDVERTLVGFWQDLLGVAQVGVRDSFFDLGGHSLIAVRLFAMVKKAWRVDFPISILFEAPTIAACAALITRQLPAQIGGTADAVPTAPVRRFTHLVPMHQGEGGVKSPFFLVAGMFGNVLNLRHLAQLLGGDRPFYGSQARGLYGDAQPHATIPEAAADYIAELRQVQPQGPYQLGGFSGGGLTAWEMARQLEAAGDVVSVLVLLDTPLPMRPLLSMADKARIKLAELRAKGPGYLVEWARARRDWARRDRSVAEAGDAAFHNAAIEAAFRAALPGYQMTQRKGPTVLFRPPLDRHWQVTGGRWVSHAKEYVFSDNDLTQFAPGLQVVEVPGDHNSMVLEPNVRVLAARLRKIIRAPVPSAPVTLAAAAE